MILMGVYKEVTGTDIGFLEWMTLDSRRSDFITDCMALADTWRIGFGSLGASHGGVVDRRRT